MIVKMPNQHLSTAFTKRRPPLVLLEPIGLDKSRWPTRGISRRVSVL